MKAVTQDELDNMNLKGRREREDFNFLEKDKDKLNSMLHSSRNILRHTLERSGWYEAMIEQLLAAWSKGAGIAQESKDLVL